MVQVVRPKRAVGPVRSGAPLRPGRGERSSGAQLGFAFPGLATGPAAEVRGDGLDAFHPAVATWFRRRFPDGPTPPQAEGWPAIASGADTLIAAPTGSGKTLAGFLVAIDALYRAHAAGDDVGATARVVYVSPLKALAVDIAHNLERPLCEIAEVAVELGLDPAPIRVGVRTGDTTSSQRASMVRRPPAFVVTTPESLYLLVSSPRGRDALRTVQSVIVDEIHAVARDKRGAHLALTLERLEALCGRRPTRVGLSATQRPIDTVGRLLVGDRPLPTVVDVGHRRDLDLALELPDGELEAVASAEQMADVLDRVATLVGEHRTTIVFVNTRRLAERLAHQLGERLGDDVVAAHHGSLSKDRRHRVETRLRAGDLRALVATASLELGIDIGPVELVCQIGSPRSIATFLQRVGRSNHTRSGTPKGRIYPMTRDELVECTALLAAVRAGRLDAIVPSRLPLDIAAQHVVAEVGAREWRTGELYDLVRRAAPFTQLSRDRFDEVVELVTDGIETGRGRRGAYLHHDAVNGELRPRRGARLAAATSGGAIPETGDYRVVAEPDDTPVGTVNEDWAVESMAGDIFLLGTHSWQIRRIEAGVVRVHDAGDTPPTVPFWQGEAPARTAELSEEVSRLRRRVDELLAGGDPDEARRWLAAVAGIGPEAATMIVDYLAAGRAVLGAMPTQTCLVLERFFDGTGGMQLVVHSPYGGRINRGLGLALRKKFCRTFNFELQAAASDDAVVLSLGPHHSFPLDEVPRYVSSRTVRDTLEHAVLDSPMFQARWRWNLNRALVVLRFRGGKRNPPPLQRMESDDLLAAVFPQAAACQENVTGPIEIPDHLLVRQTLDDTLHEALDVDGLRELLARIETGDVMVHCADTTEASVLAHEIITAKPYAFLDDEETQNRRTNAVTLRRGLQVDLSSVGALDPAAIEQVQAEVEPAPTTADDLHDLLASLVVVRAHEPWRPMFEELAARGRAHALPVPARSCAPGDPAAARTGVIEAGNVGSDDAGSGPGVAGGHDSELWCTTEALADARLALGLCDDGDAADDAAADAVVRAVRGHLEIAGLTTASRLAVATTMPAARVEWALLALQQSGVAMQGRYTAAARGAGAPAEAGAAFDDDPAGVAGPEAGGPGGAGDVDDAGGTGRGPGAPTGEPEWVARRLLARMHSYSRRSRRRRVQPATAQDLMRFLLRWQHVAPGTQLDGQAGLSALVEQLQGFESAAVAWESEVFARRLRRLDPAWLDRLCHDGEVGWLRLTPGTRRDAEPDAPSTLMAPSKATPISVVLRADLGWLLGAARTAGPEPVVPSGGATTEIVEALGQRGACFATDVAAATGRLPDDIERGLWDGVARGLLMSDGFGAIRARVAGPATRPAHHTRRLSRLAQAARATGGSAGRWSIVPAADTGIDRDDLAEAVAGQLLARWGVVCRDLAAHDSLSLPWRDVQWALRRLEDRGLVKGGRFVAGLGGEQYALPEAAEQLAQVRKAPRSGERVVVNATDPLNLVGVVLPGARVPAVRTNTVTYVDGVPLATQAAEMGATGAGAAAGLPTEIVSSSHDPGCQHVADELGRTGRVAEPTT
ncbi:MAG TPA: DEAD/DEAH box helicase [Acidimicrobiales bacterium]|nr:DEAD/DEAH box helicase [Acidimicrobiales bacterium]